MISFSISSYYGPVVKCEFFLKEPHDIIKTKYPTKCKSCHKLFTRLNQIVTKSDNFIFTQVILQCKIAGIVSKNLLSDRNIARLKSLGVKVRRKYNNSVFLRFELLGSIQLTVRGYVKLFLSRKLLRSSQENLYPSVNFIMKQGLGIEHGVCDLKCVN